MVAAGLERALRPECVPGQGTGSFLGREQGRSEGGSRETGVGGHRC